MVGGSLSAGSVSSGGIVGGVIVGGWVVCDGLVVGWEAGGRVVVGVGGVGTVVGVLTRVPRTHSWRLLLAVRNAAALHETRAPVLTLRKVIARLRVVGAAPAA